MLILLASVDIALSSDRTASLAQKIATEVHRRRVRRRAVGDVWFMYIAILATRLNMKTVKKIDLEAV